MKTRKLFAAALALVMVLAMAVPTFAAEQTVTVAGNTTVPTIKMVMSSNSKSIILNPYEMDVTVVGADGSDDTSTDQIANDTITVKNLSDCNIKVAIKASATVSGNAALSTSAPTTAEKGNKVFLTLTANVQDDDTALTALTTEADGCLIIGTSAKEMQGFKVADDATTGKNILNKSADGTAAADAKAFLALRFGGSMAKNPNADWTKNDKVTTSIVFGFTPTSVAAVEAAG